MTDVLRVVELRGLWVIYPQWLRKGSSWARIVGGIEGEPKLNVLGNK